VLKERVSEKEFAELKKDERNNKIIKVLESITVSTQESNTELVSIVQQEVKALTDLVQQLINQPQPEAPVVNVASTEKELAAIHKTLQKIEEKLGPKEMRLLIIRAGERDLMKEVIVTYGSNS